MGERSSVGRLSHPQNVQHALEVHQDLRKVVSRFQPSERDILLLTSDATKALPFPEFPVSGKGEWLGAALASRWGHTHLCSGTYLFVHFVFETRPNELVLFLNLVLQRPDLALFATQRVAI